MGPRLCSQEQALLTDQVLSSKATPQALADASSLGNILASSGSNVGSEEALVLRNQLAPTSTMGTAHLHTHQFLERESPMVV
uniref:Uncharacterized protein n=1 Tax=Arundo donax TaxID=35708 RepID=A0A0A9BTG1_ARUDO